LSKFDFGGQTVAGIVGIIMPYVEAHQHSLDPDNIRDFLDIMLLETKKNADPDSCFSTKLGIPTIVNSMIDLFMAGMETTSSSLVFAFLHLLHHPEVQKKVHREISLVCFLTFKFLMHIFNFFFAKKVYSKNYFS
jgi:cytochrome P450